MCGAKLGIPGKVVALRVGVAAALLALSTPCAGADTGVARGGVGNAQARAIDVVQVDGNRVYYLHDIAGLVIDDVSDAARPRLVGRLPMVGWPFGVVVRNEVATVVMRWIDTRSAAGSEQGPPLVRAIDLRDPANSRVLGQSSLEGVVRDARVTDSTLYVLSEMEPPGTTHTIVTAFRLDGSDAASPRTLRREGMEGALRIVDGCIVLAYDVGGLGTRVELIADRGSPNFEVSGSIDLPMTMGRGERDVSEWIHAEDLGHVRVLGCRATRCAAGDELLVVTVDASDPTHPRVVSKRSIRSPGQSLAIRFDGPRLYLSRRGWLGLGAPTTSVLVADLDAIPPRRERVLALPGAVVWNLQGSAGSPLLALATRGNAEGTRVQVLVDSIGVDDGAPSLDSEAVLGREWTWSPAMVSSGALSICGAYVAVPFRDAESGSVRPRSAVAILDRSARGVEHAREVAIHGVIERLVCVHEKLFAVTDEGIGSIGTDDGALPGTLGGR